MTVQVITIMIVFVAIVLALTFVPRIFGGEEKKLTKHLKNNLSSAKLDRKLKGFALRNGYKYLPACHFEKGEQALDVSGILIGYFGVLAVIANGRNGEIYGTANDDQWLQTTEKEKVYFENPINTASLAIRLIREPLSAARVHNVMVECLPVFTTHKVSLAVPKSCNIYTMKTFNKQLGKSKYLEDKKVNIDEVANALMGNVIKK